MIIPATSSPRGEWRSTFGRAQPSSPQSVRLAARAPSDFIVNIEPMTSAVSTLSDEEWHLLNELFEIREQDVTRWMLNSFFELRSVLYELMPRVWSLFGGSTHVRLEHLNDEDTAATGELFAVILANQSHETARDLLDVLDDTWWLETSARVANCLNIVVLTPDP